MKIFLSGKVDERFGQWRDALLGFDYKIDKIDIPQYDIPRWCIYTPLPEYGDKDSIRQWPTKNNIVLNTHDYVGPYRQVVTDYDDVSDLGYFHGVTSIGQHGLFYEGEQRIITEQCKRAINDCDIFFAYINSPDCFGTFVEIGYASGLNKFIAIAYSYPNDGGCETWFADYFADELCYQQGNQSEKEFVKESLLGAISVRTVWTSKHNTLIHESFLSFNAISRWSSDPRVRNEASRMLTKLGKARS